MGSRWWPGPIQRHEVIDDGEELERANVTGGRAVTIAIHEAGSAALISERGRRWRRDSGAARINGGAARDQGMGLGRPAVVGQRGIEDVRELDPGGGHDIRGAGGEALHPGGAVHAKEVVVVGSDRAIRDGLKISGPVGAVLPETSVRARVRVPPMLTTPPPPPCGGIPGDGAVGHGEVPP